MTYLLMNIASSLTHVSPFFCLTLFHFYLPPSLLLKVSPPRTVTKTPLFNCLPPPHFNQLKIIILDQYSKIQKIVPPPKFIHRRHKTLGQELIKAAIKPSDVQLVDIALTLQDSSTPAREHIKLPNLKATVKTITPCQNNRCATCKTHMICSNAFKCTRTGPVRHHCTCATSNVIYLISAINSM